MLGTEVTLCGVDTDVAAPIAAEHVPFAYQGNVTSPRIRTRSESDRTFGSPLDPYTRGGGQAPRATKITGHESTAVEFSTNTGDPGTHENRWFGPETRPIAVCGASARLDAF
jgi:hypothetical protein